MIRLRLTAGIGSIATLLMIATGCGQGSRPETANSDRAQATLHAALDAWKAGETPDALAAQSPPIHVKDVDWKGGFRLVGYRTESDGKLVGYDMNYPVVLELRSPKGVSLRKTAVYTVTTSPGLLVSRQEG
jgi:hypothetical protein